MSVTRFAFTHYRFVWVLIAAGLVLGALGYLRMPRQEDPSLSAFNGVITVVYPGATVDEIENRVVDPLENELQDIEEIEMIETTVRPGFAVVNAEFREDSDTERAYDLLVQQLAVVQPEFPEGVVEVRSFSAKPSNVAVLEIALHGENARPADLLFWAEELESRLRSLSDAKRVQLSGESKTQLIVTVDPDRIAAAGASLGQVHDALAAANGNIPGGVVHAGSRRLSVRSVPRFESVENIETAVLRTVEGRPLLVRDVAEVSWGEEDPVYITRYNGDPAVVVTLSLKEGRNVFHLSEAADAILAAFKEDLPPGLATTIVADQSEDVRSRLRTFGLSLFQGGLIISLFVALFAGIRPALAVIVALGLSIGISFLWMELFGIALQQMSIAGLVVVIGLLVDNAIVVVESIQQERRTGKSPEDAAIRGADRVSGAVASSTATTLAAFMPMLLMAGSVGEFTRDIPIVVCIVLIVSLGIALTVTPLLTSRAISGHSKNKSLGPWFRRVIGEQMYRPLLGRVVRTPKRVLGFAFLAGILPFLAAPFLGMTFFPVAEKPIFLVRILAPEGTSIQSTSERAAVVERWMLEQSGVLSVITNVGEANPTVYYNQLQVAGASNLAELLVRVDRESISTIPSLARQAREEFATNPDFRVETKPFIQGPPIGLPVSVRITGNDLARLGQHADQLARSLRSIPGAINIANGLRPGPARLDLEVDPIAVDRLGLNNLAVAREVRLALAGGTATQIREGGEDRDVVVRYAKEGDARVKDLGRLRFPIGNGDSVPLSQLTRPKLAATYAEINHTDLRRSVIVGADLDGRLATEVMGDLWPSVDALDLNAEESVAIIGEDEERDRAFLSMLTNLTVAGALIYGVLVLQFRSFVHPLVIFSSVPIAFGGSFAGLLFTGWPFGFTAFIGLLALTGIVVNNAIVLVDQINQLRDEGMSLEDALVQGALSRLQPIFLTTATTIAGLFPLTMTGSSMWTPMGWVIIGGLFSSTFVSLALVPTLYFVVERRRQEGARLDTPNPTCTREKSGMKRSTAAVASIVLFLSVSFGLLTWDKAMAEPESESNSATWSPTFSEVLSGIREQNPDLSAARAGTAVAKSSVSAAKSARWPTIQAQAGWEQTDDPTSRFGLALASGQNPLSGGTDGSIDAYRGVFSTRWVLWDAARESRIDAVESSFDGQSQVEAATAEQLDLAAAQLYFGLRAANETMRIQEAALTQIQTEVKNAEARFRSGRSVEAVHLSLVARESEIELARIRAAGEVDILQSELSRLLGKNSLRVLLPGDTEKIPRIDLRDLSAGYDIALSQRPEILTAGARVRATRNLKSASSRQRLPILVGSASYTAVAPEREFDHESRTYAAKLGLEWIPFRGGAIRAEQSRASAEMIQAEEQLRSTKLAVRRDVLTAWTHRVTAEQQVHAAAAGMAAATEAFRIVELRFGEGRDTLERYLQAELARTESEGRHVQASVSREIAEAELHWALGIPLLSN